MYLSGRIGKEPELRNLQNGNNVVAFSLASTEFYKDREGNKKEITDWFDCEAWGNLADVINKFFHKGDPIILWGKIKQQKSEKDGVTRYFTKFRIDEFEFPMTKKSETAIETPSVEPPPLPKDNSLDDEVPF